MTDTVPVLRARNTTAVAPATIGETHSVEMAKATAIARAGELVPKQYRANPGAVLLALGWADQHGIDVWTAMESMAFIHGKRTITAEMQAALADRAGYRVIPTDVSEQAATVTVVTKAGEKIGEATFTMADAKSMDLDGKDNWRKMPKQMLVARARTQAIRWFCPGVLVGTMDADEVDDPVHTITATLDAPPQAPQPSGEGVAVVDGHQPMVPSPDPLDHVEDAELVDDDDDDPGGPITAATRGQVRAAIDVAKAAGRWPHPLADLLDAAGIPNVATRMTEGQAQDALVIFAGAAGE